MHKRIKIFFRVKIENPVNFIPPFSEGWRHSFPGIQQIVDSIQTEKDFLFNSIENPDYLSRRIMLQATYASFYDKWKQFKPLVRHLAICYREKTYGPSPFPLPLSYFEKALIIDRCVQVHIFTNEGRLLSEAPQKAWRSAVEQIALNYHSGEASNERQATLRYLLPQSPCLLLPEDQYYLSHLICSQIASPPLLAVAEILLNAFQSNSPETKKEAILTAAHVNDTNKALLWLEEGNPSFFPEELGNFLFSSIVHNNKQMLSKLLSLMVQEHPQDKKKILETALHQSPSRQGILMHLSIYDGYDSLTFLLLDQMIKAPSATIGDLLKLACAIGRLSVAIRLADHPAIDPQLRGEALYIAARYQQLEILEMLSQRPVDDLYRGFAMIFEAEQNNAQAVATLYRSGPTPPSHAKQMLSHAVEHQSPAMIRLRLESKTPLPDSERIEALHHLASEDCPEEIIALLRPSSPTALRNTVCYPNYPHSTPAPSYLHSMTTEELMLYSPPRHPYTREFLLSDSLLYWTPFSLEPIRLYRSRDSRIGQ